jgi:hypothetical protein
MATEMLTVERILVLEADHAYCEALGDRPSIDQVLHRDAHYRERDRTYGDLLEMAKAHLELVSALEHLRESERAVLTEWCRQPGEAEYALCPETILKLATNRGWQSPTAKGGNDG